MQNPLTIPTVTDRGVEFTEEQLLRLMQRLEDVKYEMAKNAEKQRLAALELLKPKVNNVYGPNQTYIKTYISLSPALVKAILAKSSEQCSTDYITVGLDGDVHFDEEESGLRMPTIQSIVANRK